MTRENNEAKNDKKQARLKMRFLSTAVEETADNVLIADRDGVILYINPAFERTTGYSKEEVLGKTPRLLKSGKHKASFYKDLWGTILSGKVFRGVLVNKRKNGELFHADHTITPIKDADGKITHFVSVWKDITERMHYREQLELLNKSLEFEKKKFQQILAMDEKIGSFTDLNKLTDFIIQGIVAILEVERCSLMIVDEKTGELVIKGAVGLDHKIMKESKLSLGQGVAGLVAQERKPLLVRVIDEDERVGRGNLPSYKTKSFLSVPILLDQKLLGVLNVSDRKPPADEVFTDFDLRILLSVARQAAVALENTQLYKELKYLTVTDPLTDLYNYRHFMRALEYEIGRFHHFHHPLSLLVMDVDDFKEYNDAWGAAAGDFLLREISAVLHKTLRGVDIICRYASDEFVVILPGTDIAQAKAMAEDVRSEVSRLDLKKKITISLGLVSCGKGMSRHDFILKADATLSQAKKRGKNQIYCQDKKENAG
ncbi:MAG: diguanylate cyclase [Candidatus Omnitrophica bacterium]|nr:diguanylate cyclase [Candidatus Omnitrophota bacterium]